MPLNVPAPVGQPDLPSRRFAVDRRTERAITAIRSQVVVDLAVVEARQILGSADARASATVTDEWSREMTHLTGDIMDRHTGLSKRADALAGADPMLRDDLTFFLQVSKLGHGEMLTNYTHKGCEVTRR